MPPSYLNFTEISQNHLHGWVVSVIYCCITDHLNLNGLKQRFAHYGPLCVFVQLTSLEQFMFLKSWKNIKRRILFHGNYMKFKFQHTESFAETQPHPNHLCSASGYFCRARIEQLQQRPNGPEHKIFTIIFFTEKFANSWFKTLTAIYFAHKTAI